MTLVVQIVKSFWTVGDLVQYSRMICVDVARESIAMRKSLAQLAINATV